MFESLTCCGFVDSLWTHFSPSKMQNNEPRYLAEVKGRRKSRIMSSCNKTVWRKACGTPQACTWQKDTANKNKWWKEHKQTSKSAMLAFHSFRDTNKTGEKKFNVKNSPREMKLTFRDVKVSLFSQETISGFEKRVQHQFGAQVHQPEPWQIKWMELNRWQKLLVLWTCLQVIKRQVSLSPTAGAAES